MNDTDAIDEPVLEEDDVQSLIELAGERLPVSPARTARVRAAVEAEWSNAVQKRSRRNRAWMGLAAAAAFAVITFVLSSNPVTIEPVGVIEIARGSLRLDKTTAFPGASIETNQRLTTEQGSYGTFRLASGTTVRLDEETSIEFETPSRVHLLGGAMYVDSPGFAGPDGIEIVAGDSLIREIGTRFSTRFDDSTIVVRVREGRVRVSADGSTEVTRGMEVRVSASGELQTRSIEIFGDEWGWIEAAAPPFVLEGRSVAEFLDWVEDETGLEVDASALDEDFLNDTLLHGSAEGLTPSQAIEAVLPASGLEATTAAGRIVVNRPN